MLKESPLPRYFDLFSLDIDSYDYWIWRSLQDYRPTIVVVEYNPFFAPTEAKTLPLNLATEWPYFGASPAALESLGRAKDYRLVGYTSGLNLFFVLEQFARGLFERLPVRCVPTEPHDVRQQWTQWDRFVDV
ncbi:MAG: hypothetical protein QF681_00085 [Vicinamibacterales bacterium]|nr:hypothetical protein [Vicinamibacterales bacterium]